MDKDFFIEDWMSEQEKIAYKKLNSVDLLCYIERYEGLEIYDLLEKIQEEINIKEMDHIGVLSLMEYIEERYRDKAYVDEVVEYYIRIK